MLFGGNPVEPGRSQFEALKGHLKAGGSAAFFLAEGGEERLGTNVNYLLEEYGMTVHKDSVVRQTPWGTRAPRDFVVHLTTRADG